MYYTTDGSTPTTSSSNYTTTIPVTKNTTISAITTAYGYLNSPVSSGNFQIQGPTPTFSPSAGTYYGTQNVTISDTTTGATIYYTTNNTIPSVSSTPCSNPCSLTVSATSTIRAIASGGGYAGSNVAVSSYTISASAPTFSPSAGTYYAPQTITISDATPGTTIYYTKNNTFPSTSSPSCTSPCAVRFHPHLPSAQWLLGTGSPKATRSRLPIRLPRIRRRSPRFQAQSRQHDSLQFLTVRPESQSTTRRTTRSLRHRRLRVRVL